MRILIFNIGSQTIKYTFCRDGALGKKETIYAKVSRQIIEKIIRRFNPDVVVHRIVHGGNIRRTCFVTGAVLEEAKRYAKFAPLHNPFEIRAIEICGGSKNLKQIAVFDTTFFSSLSRKARTYPLPLSLAEKYDIKRYGFHGMNHKHVWEQVSKRMERTRIRLVSCHLGAGCSIAAIKDGKAADISMGLTPMEGPCMVTRSGTIDPGIILFLVRKFGSGKTDKILNEESGILGLSGTANFEKVVGNRHDEANAFAFEVFCYSVAKHIASAVVALGGVDAIAFSGGIGEASEPVRGRILDYLKFLKFKTFVVKANEEEIMLQEALKLLK